MPVPKSRAAAPFSLRLDADLRARLDKEAVHADRSASYIASKAIEAFLDARAEKRRAVEVAFAEAEKGAFVSAEAMDAWMDSWGEPDEKPFPGPDVKARRR